VTSVWVSTLGKFCLPARRLHGAAPTRREHLLRRRDQPRGVTVCVLAGHREPPRMPLADPGQHLGAASGRPCPTRRNSPRRLDLSSSVRRCRPAQRTGGRGHRSTHPATVLRAVAGPSVCLAWLDLQSPGGHLECTGGAGRHDAPVDRSCVMPASQRRAKDRRKFLPFKYVPLRRLVTHPPRPPLAHAHAHACARARAR
jgi:hypothetical protein